MRHGQKTSNS